MRTRIRRVAMPLFPALLGAACAHPPRALPSPVAGLATVERSFDFRTIQVPAARRTTASGINDDGQIVGNYEDSVGTHAFVLRDDTFTTIDFPGAAFTVGLGIGPRGEIVGAYRMPGEPAVNFHGFLRTRDGRIERVDAPSHRNTIAQRILPDGTILGCRHDDDFGTSMKGAVLTARNYSETEAFASMHNGATPDLRRIVGLYNYAPADRSAGYVIDDGKFQSLAVPGSEATSAWDVNPTGEIVGSYRDPAGVHGFVLTADGFVSVNVPRATMTRALGINARGMVVGSFELAGRISGFLATPKRAGAR